MPDFSKKAGIDNATVAIYGGDNFVIDNIQESDRDPALQMKFDLR